MKSLSYNLIAERVKRDLKMNKCDDKIATVDYINSQIHFLNQVPLLLLCKSVLVMTDDFYPELIRISWNLLLNSDQEVASSAGN